jgi:simple sugar transport system permease protein
MPEYKMNFILKHRHQLIITSILILLLCLFMFLSPRTFLSSGIYSAYMSTIPFTAILALGLTLVIVCGEMDLSFPAVMAASGFVFSLVFIETGSVFLSVAAAVFTGGLCGALNAFLIVKIGVPSIIATIGTQFFIRGLTVLLAQGLAKSLIGIRDTFGYQILSGRIADFIPMQFVWLVILTIVFLLILNSHVLGDRIRFTGDNANAARIMGISVNKTKTFVFIIMGLCSGFSGVLVCSEMANWWPTQGEGFMLIVFASVFIGGTSVFGGKGTIYGTFIGSIIISMIEAGLVSAGAQGLWTRFVYGIVIITAVSFYAKTSDKKNGE